MKKWKAISDISVKTYDKSGTVCTQEEMLFVF
jgi:hypothetical protein